MGAIPVHHTATIDTEWDAAKARAGYPNKEDVLRYCHAYVDSSGDPDAKDSYADPHHMTQGGPANLPACRNGLARLSNTDATDKAGIKAHLQAHLDDGDPDREQQKSRHHGGQRIGRTAAVRTVTIDELEAGTELELESAHKRRTKMKMEIQAILNGAQSEGRPNLTGEEQGRVDELFLSRDAAAADIDGIKDRLARIKKLRAEEIAGEAAERSVEPTGVSRPKYDEVARVGREERTYHKGWDRKGGFFLQDVVRQQLFNDHQATARLQRHMHEEQVERAPYLQRAVGTAAFSGLVVPQYLTDMYAPAIAAMRPFADICNQHDLPESGMTVNISRITTATSAALQASEGDAVSATDADDTLLTINVQTIAGQQTISRQAAERGTGIEEVVMDDLFRRYATTYDSTLLNQSVTGLSAVAASVTYDDASPTGVEAWPKILQGAANSEAALLGFARPDAVIMHSRRWYWLQSQLAAQWPLFGQPGITENRGGENYGLKYGAGYRGMMPNGMAAIVDNNCSTTISSTHDEIYIVATDECHTWSDPNAPVFIRAEQPAAATLGILLVLYGYMAYTFSRYSNAMSKITGTAFGSPVF